MTSTMCLFSASGRSENVGPKPRRRPKACDKFPHDFKAARRAARAAASARSPSLPLALPLRRRQRRSAGAKSESRSGRRYRRQVYRSSAEGAVPSPAAELSEAGQNPSRPSVTAGQPQPSSCLVNVHAKTTLTEPARTRRWQLSEAGTRVARALTLKGQHRPRQARPNVKVGGPISSWGVVRRPARAVRAGGLAARVRGCGGAGP